MNKQEIARSFDRAAQVYDQFAHFQRQVGHELLERMPGGQAERLLDLGCGTGYFSAPLLQRFSQVDYIGIDLADGMIQQARRNYPDRALQFQVGDMDALPLEEGSVDRVFMSLVLQWSRNLPETLSELRRIVHSQGVISIATLGPDTLFELRQAWGQVDRQVHVNDFVPRPRLETLVEQAGFSCDLQEEHRQLRDRNPLALMRDVKGIGAHNLNEGRARGLTGKGSWQYLAQGYEAFRGEDGLLPATYQLFYLTLRPLV